eukprot:2817743-Rhodomonas_salina.1
MGYNEPGRPPPAYNPSMGGGQAQLCSCRAPYSCPASFVSSGFYAQTTWQHSIPECKDPGLLRLRLSVFAVPNLHRAK